MGHAHRKSRFTRSRTSDKQKGAASKLLGLDQVEHEAAGLARWLLANEALGHRKGRSILIEAEATDVRVDGDALLAVAGGGRHCQVSGGGGGEHGAAGGAAEKRPVRAEFQFRRCGSCGPAPGRLDIRILETLKHCVE